MMIWLPLVSLLVTGIRFFCLLMGLGSGYESFVTSMLIPPILPYRDIVPLLQGYEIMKIFHNLSNSSLFYLSMAFIGERVRGPNNYCGYNNKDKHSIDFSSKGQ